MGLDVTAFSRIRKVGDIPPRGPAREAIWDSSDLVLFHTDFPDRCDKITPGVYAVDGEEFRFRGGSYSGYNHFRDTLSLALLGAPARAVWSSPERYAPMPGFSLVNFSDCEGWIGTLTAERLSGELSRSRGLFLRHAHDDWDVDRYDNFIRAFIIASDAGCVKFH